MTKQSKPLKFEEAISKLEEMTEKLEEGELSLEDSLKTFEEGMALTKFCEEKLNEAQGKIEMLVKDASGKKVKKKIN